MQRHQNGKLGVIYSSTLRAQLATISPQNPYWCSRFSETHERPLHYGCWDEGPGDRHAIEKYLRIEYGHFRAEPLGPYVNCWFHTENLTRHSLQLNILCYALWQIAYLSQEESTATALPRDLTAAWTESPPFKKYYDHNICIILNQRWSTIGCTSGEAIDLWSFRKRLASLYVSILQSQTRFDPFFIAVHCVIWNLGLTSFGSSKHFQIQWPVFPR